MDVVKRRCLYGIHLQGVRSSTCWAQNVHATLFLTCIPVTRSIGLSTKLAAPRPAPQPTVSAEGRAILLGMGVLRSPEISASSFCFNRSKEHSARSKKDGSRFMQRAESWAIRKISLVFLKITLVCRYYKRCLGLIFSAHRKTSFLCGM